jgi:hypothetical protein
MRLPIKPLCLLALTSFVALAARAQETLPADVYADSRSRLPSLGSETPAGVDRIIAHGSGALVRWEFALGRALSELAVLTTAREFDQPYEWSLHELEALAVGLEPRVIDIVRDRLPLTGISEREAIIIQTGREIFGEQELTAETYARAEALLGRANLVDIVMLMGEYAEDAVRLTAFNQYMPPGWRQFLPLPFTPPDDIHPDSRSRLPYLRNETRGESATPSIYGRGLAPEGTGPGQIMRRSRDLETLRASVGPRLVRLTNLIAARELGDVYQWTMNEIAAPADGLEPAIIDVVRQRAAVNDLTEADAALIEFGRELLTAHTVSPSTYARVLELFSEIDLVGFVNVMAKSASDSTLLIAFQQQLPAGQEPLL